MPGGAQDDDSIGQSTGPRSRTGGSQSLQFREAALQGRDDVIGGPFHPLLHLASFRQAITLDGLPAEPPERAAEHEHQAQEHPRGCGEAV